MKRCKYSLDELKKAVEENVSMAGGLRSLGLRAVGGNYKTVNYYIKENNIDKSHFTGQGWNVGLKFKPFKRFTDEEIFIVDSKYRSTHNLKKRYIETTGKTKCEICGIDKWNYKILALEIHHINGVNTDNRLDNLQLLCPNCHSQTETFRGRIKLSALNESRDVEFLKFGETLTDNADGNPELSLRDKESVETKQGKPKSTKSKIIWYG